MQFLIFFLQIQPAEPVGNHQEAHAVGAEHHQVFPTQQFAHNCAAASSQHEDVARPGPCLVGDEFVSLIVGVCVEFLLIVLVGAVANLADYLQNADDNQGKAHAAPVFLNPSGKMAGTQYSAQHDPENA